MGEADRATQVAHIENKSIGVSLCCTPLISRGAALGTLNLGSRQEDFFASGELQFYSQVAGQIAIALDNALSYRRIEELNAQLAEEKLTWKTRSAPITGSRRSSARAAR